MVRGLLLAAIAVASLAACSSAGSRMLPSSFDGRSQLGQLGPLNGFDRLTHSWGGPASPFVDLNQVKGVTSRTLALGIDDATDAVGCESEYPGDISYPCSPFLYSRGSFGLLSFNGSNEGIDISVASPGLGEKPLSVADVGGQWVLFTGGSGQAEPNFSPDSGNAYVDEAGDIAGSSTCGPSCGSALVQLANGKLFTPFPPTSGMSSGATGIKTQADKSVGVVGSLFINPSGPTSLFYYNVSNGHGTCCAEFGTASYAEANSVNSHAVVVGDSPLGSAIVAVPAGKSGIVTTLPASGYNGSYANSINDYNEIAGIVEPPTGVAPALWIPQTIKKGSPETYQLYTISSLFPHGWSNVTLDGINDHEQIVGFEQPVYDSFILALHRQAIDVSYPAQTLNEEEIKDLLTTGPYWSLLVIGLYGGKTANAYAAQQAHTALKNHMPVAGYVFLNFQNPGNNTGTHQMDVALQALCPKSGPYKGDCVKGEQLSFIALDVEKQFLGTATPAQRQKVINQAALAAPKVPLVIYTASSKDLVWSEQNLGDWGKSGNCGGKPCNPYRICPLWEAHGDQVDSLFSLPQGKKIVNLTLTAVSGGYVPDTLFAGWDHFSGKQYSVNTQSQAIELADYTGILTGASEAALDLDNFSWDIDQLPPPCQGGSLPPGA